MAKDVYMAIDIDHAAIRESPGDYILCFSFFDMKHLLDIKPEGGNYIYSSCELSTRRWRLISGGSGTG
jgi:ribonuclease J